MDGFFPAKCEVGKGKLHSYKHADEKADVPNVSIGADSGRSGFGE